MQMYENDPGLIAFCYNWTLKLNELSRFGTLCIKYQECVFYFHIQICNKGDIGHANESR